MCAYMKRNVVLDKEKFTKSIVIQQYRYSLKLYVHDMTITDDINSIYYLHE